jgi:uncharacterized membrane protein (UPF0127 family)
MKLFSQRYLIPLLITIFLIFVFLFFNMRKMKSVNILVNKIPMRVFVAEKQREQRIGLSSFSSIKENEAMLFIFKKNKNHVFWMKDMNFPIDIVWLDSNKKIIFIKEHALPSDYPDVYDPRMPSRYVFEFHDGFVRKNNLEIGSYIDFNLRK